MNKAKMELALLGLTELTQDELQCIRDILGNLTVASFATEDDMLHTFTAKRKIEAVLESINFTQAQESPA